MVHGKGAGIQIVLVPYAPADSEAIVRLVNGKVDADDDGQNPREQGQDLVREDGAAAVRLPPAERVPCDADISMSNEQLGESRHSYKTATLP